MEEIRGTIQLDANISNARKGIEQLAQTFQSMGGEKGNSFLNTLTQIEKEIDKLENKSGSSVTKIGDFTPAEKSTEKISLLLKKLQKDMGDVDALSKSGKMKLFPPDVANNIKNAADAIKVYTNSMKASDSKSGAIGKATAEYNKQTREVENLSQKMEELENRRKSGTTVDQSGFNNQKKLVTDLTQQYDSLIAKVENAKRARDEYAATGGKGGGALKNPSASKPYQNLDADYQEALKQAEEVKIKADEARQAFNNMYIPSELEQELEQTSSKLEQAKIKAEEMKTNLADVRATAMNKSLEEAKEKLKGIADVDLNSITSMEDLKRVIEQLTEKGFQELETATNSAKQGINGLAQENDKMNSSLRESKSELQEQNRALEDINGLKSRIQYFFSLTNTAMLARRAIQQAFETVKELDAAMTETAVVTDFSIGDMWEKLPEYTKMANELGVSTKGVYEASTLYYQQGLQTEEVMALTNETLKMARIAGLECADATNLMTAALRGFNMEIDETNSKRINDVYSELAAITAADTEEIATAMTKTASIAYSANMEFETTAALLSQIIETTREPAETAGTASTVKFSA